jgi:hypothetical protein
MHEQTCSDKLGISSIGPVRTRLDLPVCPCNVKLLGEMSWFGYAQHGVSANFSKRALYVSRVGGIWSE